MRNFAAIVCVGLVLTAAAFAGGTAEPSGTQTQTIRVMWWGGQARHDLTAQAIALFESKNPGVTVQPEFSGWDGYWERLATQAAGGQIPAVVQTAIASGWGNQYAEQGLFADIYPMIERGWLDMSNVDDSTLAQNVIDGKLFGIPLGVNAPAVVYDRGLIEAAGLAVPGDNWTFEQFAGFAIEYGQATDSYGIDLFKAMNDLFPVYLRNQGATFIDADANRLGYDDDQLLVRFWDLLLQMQDNRGTTPPDLAAETFELDARLILSGRSAMTFAFSNQVGAFVTGATGPVGMAMVPGPNQNRGMFIKSALDFSVSSTERTQEQAARFVDFFTNDIEANMILRAERGVPISSAVRDALAVGAPEALAMMLDYISRVAGLNPAALDTPHPAFAELVSIMDAIEARVRYRQITPIQGAQEFRREAVAVFQRLSQ